MTVESLIGARFKPAPSVHARSFDGELVILDLEKGEYFSLDPIGSALWTGLEQGRTVEEVARTVVAEYAVTFERAFADLSALAQELISRKLLIAAKGPP